MNRTITPAEAKRLLETEGYAYLDVRTEEEFAQGHPTGAANVPVATAAGGYGLQPNADFVRVVGASYAPDSKLVVGCKSGGRSARACELLAAAGFTGAVNMDGGYDGRYGPTGELIQAGWSKEGFPTSAEAAEGADYAALKAKAG